jgi:hypothetical protein
MVKIQEIDEKQVFDSTKYLKLQIDKDGKWFQNGAEMTHPGIRLQFFEALTKTNDGSYFVRIGREVCSVLVEDAPFVVTMLDRRSDGKLFIRLSDETQEELKPDGLWIGNDNVPYALVKGGAFHARFSRAAYYQMSRWITLDEEQGQFYLDCGDRKYELGTQALV